MHFPGVERLPCGVSVGYEYSSAYLWGDLKHNLTRVIDGAGRCHIENEYGTTASAPDFNRVVRQRQGAGRFDFYYAPIDQVLDDDYPDHLRPRTQTVAVDRAGQTMRHVHNRFGNVLLREQYVIQKGVPRHLQEHFRYNRDGKIIASLSAKGVLKQSMFGRDCYVRTHGLSPNGEINTDALSWMERLSFGNLKSTVLRDGFFRGGAKAISGKDWGEFPDIVDGILPLVGDRSLDVVSKLGHDASYGRVEWSSDPRFTESPDPDAIEAPAYYATLTRYDFGAPNPDTRHLLAIRSPDATLPDGSKQIIETRFVMPNGLPAYDQGRPLRQTLPDGSVTEFDYHPGSAVSPSRAGYLLGVTRDAENLAHRTERLVDDLGRLVAIRSPKYFEAGDGRYERAVSYDIYDRVVKTTTTAPFRYEVRTFFNKSGTVAYSERDLRPNAATTEEVEVSTFCYDDELKILRTTTGGRDLSAHLKTYHRYGTSGERSRTRFPAGNRTIFRFNERTLVRSEIVGFGSTERSVRRFEYDDDGHQSEVIDGRGYRTRYERDSSGRVVAEEDALGNIVRFDFDKSGNLTAMRRFENRENGYYLVAKEVSRYDELGRPFSIGGYEFQAPVGPNARSALATFERGTNGPGQLRATITYFDEKGRPAKVVDPAGRETITKFNVADKVSEVADAAGNIVRNQYDSHWNLVRSDEIDALVDESGNSGNRYFARAFRYDEMDRLIARIDGLGNSSQFVYDSRDNVISSSDALGNRTTYYFDVHNRRRKTTRFLSSNGLGSGYESKAINVAYAYDPNGNLSQVTDALGRETHFTYDTLDRQMEIVSPDSTRTALKYDRCSNLIESIDNNGTKRFSAFDPLGRKIRVDVDDTSVTPGTTVKGSKVESFRYDSRGRLAGDRNDFAECEYSYNSMGWQQSESVTFLAPNVSTQVGTLRVTKSYDAVGALIRLEFPSHRRVAFHRDVVGRVTEIENVTNGVDYPGSTRSSPYYISRFRYQGRLLERCSSFNGCMTSYSYDANRRLTEIAHATGARSLLAIQYLCDGNGNVRLRNEIEPSETRKEIFAYDSLGRLVNRLEEIGGGF